MSKIGRNDPCPCGSGKKYKKCCQLKSNPKPSAAKERPAYLNPSLIAKQWLANQTVSQEQNATDLKLILDRFQIDSSTVPQKVRSLGKVKDNSVLLYRGKQWVAEIDLSIDGEMLLTTSELSVADELRQQLLELGSVKHISRAEETFDSVEQPSRRDQSAEMLAFKKTFFAAWPDEINERLNGLTPRQAVLESESKELVGTLLQELETREAKLPKKQRYKFAKIRKELGL